MKLCFDVNVIIDIWGRTEDFFYSYTALDLALTLDHDVCISAGSVSDIAYVLHARDRMDRSDAREALGSMLEVFDCFDVAGSDCTSVQASEMGDVEDAIMAFAAKRAHVDFIITRNKRDFRLSPVPALTPKEFVDLCRPDNLEYDIVELD